ncbi:carboxylesterase family protein [Streptomyces sp. NPDC018026]|uniref:carboxylesterase family protein n=1 Tax=Streptomyces sp. NPDC018026 TaxID=3365031 RepID=UPI00379F60A4
MPRPTGVRREAVPVDVFKTQHGSVRGFRTSGDVITVLGVPYAAAPFDAHRFRAPAPAPAWADFAATGSPGWPPVRDSTTEVTDVKVWTADHHAADTVSDACPGTARAARDRV